ncbi:hypothetical protein ADUPG1_009095 [Aduncisulcus paluster]|uniref:ribonuclease Z n=1 Tax=Aduncisulcus paluster TaxID=2918883 RepID=A0ABQ5KUC3_9EUKA|nr:hypothetical protein ADUPG1_009095 [Aduncisulcus paluster]|eukprot:gnl/Carplike_NY0171/1950_a2639_413.p1 GENE.gnl/Carplike_NY0171/1950_a2639_413~~gnl/Carplike_NY0171/1950_a2639_413.p1  ORF type:complete len:1129 (+),score=290.35 gnl/Carplike_NY0171/1950_a2639_413:83-3469(+)
MLITHPPTLRILSAGSVDLAPVAVLESDTDGTALFNCPEGTQRLFNIVKSKLASVNDIFLSHVSSQTLLGMPGLFLTQLMGASSQPGAQAKEDAGIPLLSPRVWGNCPKESPQYKLITRMMSVTAHPGSVKCIDLSVNSIVAKPSLDVTESVKNQDIDSLYSEIKKQYKLNNEVSTTIHKGTKITPIIVTRIVPGLKDDSVAVCDPTEFKDDRIFKIVSTIVGWRIDIPSLQGKFDGKRAKSLGVSGRNCGKLIAGESVPGKDGITVHPSDVVSPPTPIRPIILLTNVWDSIERVMWSESLEDGNSICRREVQRVYEEYMGGDSELELPLSLSDSSSSFPSSPISPSSFTLAPLVVRLSNNPEPRDSTSFSSWIKETESISEHCIHFIGKEYCTQRSRVIGEEEEEGDEEETRGNPYSSMNDLVKLCVSPDILDSPLGTPSHCPSFSFYDLQSIFPFSRFLHTAVDQFAGISSEYNILYPLSERMRDWSSIGVTPIDMVIHTADEKTKISLPRHCDICVSLSLRGRKKSVVEDVIALPDGYGVSIVCDEGVWTDAHAFFDGRRKEKEKAKKNGGKKKSKQTKKSPSNQTEVASIKQELDSSKLIPEKDVLSDADVYSMLSDKCKLVSKSDTCAKPSVDASITMTSLDPIVILPLGTGAAMPSKYRNVSSMLVCMKSKPHASDDDSEPSHSVFMVDCGEGALNQLQTLFSQHQLCSILVSLQVIFITHPHADHLLGLWSLISARREAFTLLGKPYVPLCIVCSVPCQRLVRMSLRVDEERCIGSEKDVVFMHPVAFLPKIESMKTCITSHSSESPSKTISSNPISVYTLDSLLQMSNSESFRYRCYGGTVWVQQDSSGKTVAGMCEPEEGMSMSEWEKVKDIAIKWHQKELDTLYSSYPSFSLFVSSLVQSFTMVPVNHCAESYALVCEGDNVVLGCSGDCMPCESFVREMRRKGKRTEDCRVEHQKGEEEELPYLVCVHEATLNPGMEDMALDKSHATVTQAMQVALLCECNALLLTHFSQRYGRGFPDTSILSQTTTLKEMLLELGKERHKQEDSFDLVVPIELSWFDLVKQGIYRQDIRNIHEISKERGALTIASALDLCIYTKDTMNVWEKSTKELGELLRILDL